MTSESKQPSDLILRLKGIAYRDEAKAVTVRADDLRAVLAALSAEPAAQGEACGYRAKNNPDCFMGPAAVAAQKAMGWDVSADPEWVPVYTAPPAQLAERVPDARIIDLAERLVASGPKAAHVSASECHEISDFILSLAHPAPSEGVKGVDDKCPDCLGYGENCLAGRSAHPSNWYMCETCNGTGKKQAAR